ncbi:protein arginine kinase [Metasolibacillus sp. FSL K6-0083]|uniref:protein arginine kinase n=1 Tax=Metasolibacillus sp. FSL K6-0083 TaxID=2921416 RepID=UPI00315AB2AF
MNIEHFLKHAPKCIAEYGEHSDIVMTTRIRLARNIANTRFPLSFSQQEANDVQEKLMKALLTPQEQLNFSYFRMADLSQLERQLLVEKHLISPYLAKHKESGAVLLSLDESTSVMVNEEDHLRIQVLSPGLQLMETYEQASKLDNRLGKQVSYAYDEQFGYLTSCPTNVGTGLRASIMMHLPALTMSKQMNVLIQMMTRIGMVVRGIYGEGSENLGNIYQISNQVTLGKSEREILEELQKVVEQIIGKERAARQKLLERARVTLDDRVNRALGTLRYARVLTSEEAASCLSSVRLGVDLKLIEGISPNSLNECVMLIQPGFVQQYAGTMLDAVDRDIYRAQYIQRKLGKDSLTTGEKGEETYDV